MQCEQISAVPGGNGRKGKRALLGRDLHELHNVVGTPLCTTKWQPPRWLMRQCVSSAGCVSWASAAVRQHDSTAASGTPVAQQAAAQQQVSLVTSVADCRSAGQFGEEFPSAQMQPSTGQPLKNAIGTIAHSAA